MKDEWEIKSVTKSGSDLNIKIGPRVSSDNAWIVLVAALMITLAIMNLFAIESMVWFFIFFVPLVVFFSFFWPLAVILLWVMIVGLVIYALIGGFE